MGCEEGRGERGAANQLCGLPPRILAHVPPDVLVSPFQLCHAEDLSRFKVVRLAFDCPIQKLDCELKVGLSEESVRLVYDISTAAGLIMVAVHTDQTSYIDRF
jgi:hypothetical protein